LVYILVYECYTGKENVKLQELETKCDGGGK